MAAIIRIKRSTGTTPPPSLKTGELAYSAGLGADSNGGDRLYFGKGDDGLGNATSIVAIGGEYFANLMDHTQGTLQPHSALITDSAGKMQEIKVDYLRINQNVISSIEGTSLTDGDIILSPKNNGVISVDSSKVSHAADPVFDHDLATKRYVDAQNTAQLFTIVADSGTNTIDLDDSDLTIKGDEWISTTMSQRVGSADSNALTISHDMSGVVAGTYGSETQIVQFTVDSAGHIDSAKNVDIATTLNLRGDSNTVGSVDLLDSNLVFVGGANINIIVESNGVTVNLDSGLSGLSSLSTYGITIDSGSISRTDSGEDLYINGGANGGEVVLNQLALGNVTEDQVLFARGVDSDGNGNTDVTVTGSNALTYDSNGTLSLTGSLEVIGSALIDNIKLDGNVISTTDSSNLIVIDPSPVGDSAGGYQGDVIVRGNLYVQGTTTQVNSTTVNLRDKNIVLADSAADSAAADGAGITVEGANATITYDHATGAWDFNRTINLADSAGLTVNDIDYKEVLQDHFVSNVFKGHDSSGQDIVYKDSTNEIIFMNQYASRTNVGTASFGGYTDSENAPFPGNNRQFSVSAKGDVTIIELDGGSY